MQAVEVRRAAEKALPGMLLLEGARGQIHMRLARVAALAEREERRLLLGHGHLGHGFPLSPKISSINFQTLTAPVVIWCRLAPGMPSNRLDGRSQTAFVD